MGKRLVHLREVSTVPISSLGPEISIEGCPASVEIVTLLISFFFSLSKARRMFRSIADHFSLLFSLYSSIYFFQKTSNCRLESLTFIILSYMKVCCNSFAGKILFWGSSFTFV